MPTYEFRSKTTGEQHSKFMSYSSRQEYLSENPDLEVVMCAPTLVYEPGTNLKVTDSFRETLSKVKETYSVNNIKSY